MASSRSPYVGGTLFSCLLAACALFATPCHADVSGTVVELGTGTPLPGALVTLQPTSIGIPQNQVVAGAGGAFDLPTPDLMDLIVVGANKGHFYSAVTVNSGATGVVIMLEPVVVEYDPDYEFDPGFCGFCHGDQFDQWITSRMGNTGSNEWVYDVYNGTGTAGGMGGFVYTRDGTNVGTDLDGQCAACHQPARWIREGGPVSNDVPLSPDLQNDELALQSVTCDVCHKVADVDTDFLQTTGPDPLAITMNLPSGVLPPQVQYGVLADVDFFDVNFMRASLQPQITHDMCGMCHEYSNDINQDGTFGAGPDQPGQTTWSEWAASSYNDPDPALRTTCVDCHTEGFGATEACDLIILNRDPETVHEMKFEGTTPEYLENAVTLSMTAVDTGSSIDVQVDIENTNAGHNVPTGVSLRNMILVIDVIRQQDGLRLSQFGGPIVGDLGGVGDPLQGDYAGLPGKIYGRINVDDEGNEGVIFTEAVSSTTTSIAANATDITNYTFQTPSSNGTIDVTARLIYRRGWRPLVVAKGWTTDGQGNPLADIVGPHYGHLMETAAETIDLGPFTLPDFIRGDADGNGVFNGLSDALFSLAFQFQGGPAPVCLEAADSDDDGVFNGLSDSLFTLTHQFQGGPPPGAPYPACGQDPDIPGNLGCGTNGCP